MAGNSGLAGSVTLGNGVIIGVVLLKTNVITDKLCHGRRIG
jgi:hypothetical protein